MNAIEELTLCASYFDNQDFTSADFFTLLGRVGSHFDRIEKQTGCAVETAWSIPEEAKIVWFCGEKIGGEKAAFHFVLLSDRVQKEILSQRRGVTSIHFLPEQLLEVARLTRNDRALFLKLGINCYDPDPVLEK